ncbi:MAG: hypothetical protein ABMB14_17370 [Myxococcota bacterium]
MRWITVLALSVSLGACNGKGSSELVFGDANNYSYTGVLDITPVPVHAGSDLTIDWAGLTTDLRGRPVDGAAIEQISLLNIASPLAEVLQLVAVNEIDQSDSQDIYLHQNDGAETSQLSAFEITGVPIDTALLVEDPNTTWLMSLMNVPDGRTDILSSIVIEPKDAEANTTVTFTDASASLVPTVKLGGTVMTVAADSAPYSMDWSGVTNDVFGHSFDALIGDELIIGHYATEDLAEIEGEFLRLDSYADALYRLDAFGVTAVDDLGAATDDGGAAFEGFTTDGTWLVGVICTTCATPVPLLLGVVEVE